MFSRNFFILAGTVFFFSVVSYTVALTGFAHEPGAPADASLWRTIGIVLMIIALITALLGVLQSMFEQADRRTPGGQAGVHRAHLERREKMRRERDKGSKSR